MSIEVIKFPETIAAEKKSSREDETQKAFAVLMRNSYYGSMGWDQRKLRQAILQALSDDMLGKKVGYEVLT